MENLPLIFYCLVITKVDLEVLIFLSTQEKLYVMDNFKHSTHCQNPENSELHVHGYSMNVYCAQTMKLQSRV